VYRGQKFADILGGHYIWSDFTTKWVARSLEVAHKYYRVCFPVWYDVLCAFVVSTAVAGASPLNLDEPARPEGDQPCSLCMNGIYDGADPCFCCPRRRPNICRAGVENRQGWGLDTEGPPPLTLRLCNVVPAISTAFSRTKVGGGPRMATNTATGLSALPWRGRAGSPRTTV